MEKRVLVFIDDLADESARVRDLLRQAVELMTNLIAPSCRRFSPLAEIINPEAPYNAFPTWGRSTYLNDFQPPIPLCNYYDRLLPYQSYTTWTNNGIWAYGGHLPLDMTYHDSPFRDPAVLQSYCGIERRFGLPLQISTFDIRFEKDTFYPVLRRTSPFGLIPLLEGNHRIQALKALLRGGACLTVGHPFNLLYPLEEEAPPTPVPNQPAHRQHNSFRVPRLKSTGPASTRKPTALPLRQ